MKKATMYFETTTLLRTCKFTSSDNKKANETKNESRMTEKKRNEVVITMVKHKALSSFETNEFFEFWNLKAERFH